MGRENIRLYFSRTLCLTSVTQVLITIIYYWEKRPRVKAEMIIEKPRQECLWSIINPGFSKNITSNMPRSCDGGWCEDGGGGGGG